jgi:hypothetical protein
MLNKKNLYVKPLLTKHGAFLELTKYIGDGKEPGPGDGKSTPNNNACSYGHYKNDTCVPDAFS